MLAAEFDLAAMGPCVAHSRIGTRGHSHSLHVCGALPHGHSHGHLLSHAPSQAAGGMEPKRRGGNLWRNTAY